LTVRRIALSDERVLVPSRFNLGMRFAHYVQAFDVSDTPVDDADSSFL